MHNDADIDDIIGLSNILNHFYDEKAKRIILITGNNKSGKSYALSAIKDRVNWATKSNIALHVLNIEDNVLWGINDYLPFIKFLDNQEDIENAKKSANLRIFVKEFSSKANAVMELFRRNSYYSAKYNDTEKGILERMTRVVSKGVNIFLCDDFDKWDFASKSLIVKLLSDYDTDWAYCSYFVFTVTNKSEAETIFSKFIENEKVARYDLKNISEDVLKNYLYKYEINVSATDLYELTGGNVGLISNILELCSSEELKSKQKLNQLIELNLLNKLSNVSNDLEKSKKAVEMINKSSIIDSNRFYKKLLKELALTNNAEFTESYLYARNAGIYNECKSMVYFKSENLRRILHTCNKDNILYHLTYANALKTILPSNYEMRAYEYLMSGSIEEAVNAYFTYAVEYMKKYRQRILLNENFYVYLDEYEFLPKLENFQSAYESYFLEDYDKANEILSLIESDNIYINYQKNYLDALLHINSSTLQSSYNDAKIILSQWVKNKTFKKEEPYLWVQTAILSLENNFELSETDINLYPEIDSIFSKYKDVDKQFEIEYYNFLSKNNYSFSIDTQYKDSKRAVDYFKNAKGLPDKNLYVCALVNYLANALVMGQYLDVINETDDNLFLFEIFSGITPFLPALFTNYLIAKIFNEPENLKKNCIKLAWLFEEIVSVRLTCDINEVLYNINLGLVYFYSGNKDKALNLYTKLYEKYAQEETVDDYYRYFIINNYNVIKNYIYREDRYEFINELENLNPLSNNKQFFTKRNKCLRLFKFKDESISNVFLPMGENILGKSWSFWGRPLLFTDVQFWTD